MEKAVTRIKKTQTIVPNLLAQADLLVGEIGKSQDSINTIQAGLAKKIAALREEAEKSLAPLVSERDSQINALFAFANAKKDSLTEKAKTVNLSSGSFGWRLTPPRVEAAESDEEIIARLKRTGNKQYIRIIEELDRQALLVERPKIRGISYLQNDEFFVVPKQKSRKAKTFTKAIDNY